MKAAHFGPAPGFIYCILLNCYCNTDKPYVAVPEKPVQDFLETQWRMRCMLCLNSDQERDDRGEAPIAAPSGAELSQVVVEQIYASMLYQIHP